MTALDWIILVAVALAALQGSRRGFLVGALSLAGFLGGAVLGARLAPLLLDEGSASPWAPALGLAGALTAGVALALALEWVGRRLRGALRLPGLGLLDGLLGAFLGACLALAFAWISGAIALQTPGASVLRDEVQRSKLLRALNRTLPPSGPILQALARFDPLPEIGGPAPEALAPPAPAALDRPAVRRAAGGTVRVLGAACGLGIEGSGWVAAAGLVVTNAHVVAGTGGDVVVQSRGDGPRLAARPVAFDPRDDVAVLAVQGLSGPVLGLAPEAPDGTAGAILGYPENGPFDARSARVGATRRVVSEDAYGRGPVLRSLTPIRGVIRHGNSGGPVVDTSGRVLTTVFAGSASSGARGGFGVPNHVVRERLRRARAGGSEVSTGPCT